MNDLQRNASYHAVLTSPSEGDAVPISLSLMLARSDGELAQRVADASLRADLTYGQIGRLPDYMNAMVTDLA